MGNARGRRRAHGPGQNLPPRVRKEEKEFRDLERLARTNPDGALAAFSRLTASHNESDRRTAAVCIDLLMAVRRKEALQLWRLLMADDEPWVCSVACEMLVCAFDQGPERLPPLDIVLSQDETYELSWEYYEAHLKRADKQIGEVPDFERRPGSYCQDDTPGPNQPGTGKQSDTGKHDSILMMEFLGLATTTGMYRERFEGACRAGKVSARYLMKHRDRLLWALALQLWREVSVPPDL